MTEWIFAARTSSLESFLQLVGVLIIFVVILFVTYLVTKWMGGFQKSHVNAKNLKSIEMIPIAPGKMIALLQAGKKFLVVSVGKEEVHLLAELSEDQLADTSFLDELPSAGPKESFQQILEKMKAKKQKK